MNARTAPVAVRAPLLEAAAFLRDAWAAVRARDVLAVVVLCLLWSSIDLAARIEPILAGRLWGPALNGVLSRQFSGIAVLYAVAIADHAARRGAARAWWYVAAVVGGTVVGTAAMWLFSQRLVGIPTAHRGAAAYEPFVHFVVRHAAGALSVCGLATAIFLADRGARRREANLGRLQRSRAELERRVAATQLAAHRARVDPAFVVDTLGRIDRGYRRDPRAADRLLRALVRYLRAAIPQVRDPDSTLRREIALANAWLQVASPEAPIRLRVEALPPLDARLPPRVLLPLVAHLLGARAGSVDVRGDLQLEAVARDARLRIVLRVATVRTDGRTAPDADVAEVRELLATFYGEDASLVLHAADGRSEAVIDVPHDPALDAFGMAGGRR